MGLMNRPKKELQSGKSWPQAPDPEMQPLFDAWGNAIAALDAYEDSPEHWRLRIEVHRTYNLAHPNEPRNELLERSMAQHAKRMGL
jgi:hypothetical protein